MKTILLIEDNEMIRMIMEKVLTRAGFQVLVSGSVLEAQRVWSEKRDIIDLVITDNSLPDGSGIDLVKTFEGEKKNLKVIVASGRNYDDLPLHYFQLHKPFDTKFLLGFVNGVLDYVTPQQN